MKKAVAKKKRLVRGEDWHAWAWRDVTGVWRGDGLGHFAEPVKPTVIYPTDGGKWVRVKFTEVK